MSNDNMSHERQFCRVEPLSMRTKCINHRRTSSLGRAEPNRTIQTWCCVTNGSNMRLILKNRTHCHSVIPHIIIELFYRFNYYKKNYLYVYFYVRWKVK